MNFTRSLACLGGLLLLGGLVTCTDHRIPAVAPGSTPTRLRVSSITQDLTGGLAKVSAFRYDASGRLGSIRTYQSPDSTVADVETSLYQYDAQNRLTQLRHTVVRRPATGSPNPVEQYEYSYNTAGQVSTLAYTIGSEAGFRLTLTYTSLNQVATATRLYQTSGLRIDGTDQFTFTGNNLTTIGTSRTVTGMGAPPTTSNSTTTLTYDNRINPFYGVFVIPAPFPAGFVNPRTSPSSIETYFGGQDNGLNLSQNNVASLTTGASTTTYQYDYSTANLPLVRRTTVGGVVVQTIRFAYESY
jgi:hypothetical protein